MANRVKDFTTLLKDVGEFGLIEELKKNISLSSSVIKGIGDDTAVVRGSKTKYTLLTTDMMIEGRHFTLDMDPRCIGRKALSCNISDIAAMGGKPLYALISLGITDKLATSFIKDIYSGLRKLADEFEVDLVGGDTVFNDKLIINIALYGEVKKTNLITRCGAKKGDMIFVTGPLGNSFDSNHHLNFIPRLKESLYLAKEFKPNAMIDISDGLAADLGHVLKASGVGANLYQEKIPLRPNADITQALLDGEDFELLFTLSQEIGSRLEKKRKCPFNFNLIGEITGGDSLNLIDAQGCVKQIEMKGFTHF